ncbi:hypothetical protein VP1G_11119 [Cytospora mali]|uniref:Uncharacterized protein n=1 Tax=Cytospora mali TaxID=578113 RepID=A0A194V655_CYTMA|nr:hypothetical protein VP1G_11119 [Valsa mali var. pyri (nom. inval.)]
MDIESGVEVVKLRQDLARWRRKFKITREKLLTCYMYSADWNCLLDTLWEDYDALETRRRNISIERLPWQDEHDEWRVRKKPHDGETHIDRSPRKL